MYESPMVDVMAFADSVAASNRLSRWENPIDPD